MRRGTAKPPRADKSGAKKFPGLPSERSLHKARPVPLSSRPQASQQVVHTPVRWLGRQNAIRRAEAEPVPDRVLYKAPLNGVMIAAEGERLEIARLMLSTPPLGYHCQGKTECRCIFGEDGRLQEHRAECPVKSVPMHRILDLLAGKSTGASIPSAPHVTKSEHHRQDLIYSQGAQSIPGVFFICEGRVKISRKNSKPLMDNMQAKLFVIGAFPGVSDEEHALRKPKSSEKDWDLGTLGPGSFFGLGGLNETYADTARAHQFSKLIFIPADVLSARLNDVKSAILQVLEDAARSRQRQFVRVTALFEPCENVKDDSRHSVATKRKMLDTGISNVKPPVVKTHGERRYQRSRGSDVAYAGPYGFRPGEVPQFNPDLLATPRDRTAFQFIQVQKTFSRPKEPGAGLDLGLPPKCEMPGTRVARLYDKLWDNCTQNTWNMLLDMQTVPETVASLGKKADGEDERHSEERLERENGAEPHDEGLLTKVPTLDLYQSSLPWDDGERPTTEPGRSRSARTSITNLRDASGDIGARQRRPMTSRPHAEPRGMELTGKRFDFPFPRSSDAARRAVAWSGPPDRCSVRFPLHSCRSCLSLQRLYVLIPGDPHEQDEPLAIGLRCAQSPHAASVTRPSAQSIGGSMREKGRCRQFNK